MGEHHRALDDELVPLSVAAAVCYFQLTDARMQRSEVSLLRAVPLAALALSQVSTIHLRVPDGPARPLSAEEVQRLLCRPMLKAAERPDLDRFLIRRGDLRAALLALRGAGIAIAAW